MKPELSPEEAEALLKQATFRIHLGRHPDEDGRMADFYGTGFFVTEDGLALTAYHNFKDCLRDQVFDATCQGKPIRLQWITAKSSVKADIGVMRLEASPNAIPIHPLRAAYLPREHPAHVRTEYFKGRRLAIWGYPQHGAAAVEWAMLANLDGSNPFFNSVEDGESIERLYLAGNTRMEQLEGISGAAMLDRELHLVIGVEGSYRPGERVYERYVCGTEIAQLVDEHPDLARHFDRLDPALGPIGDPATYLTYLQADNRYLALRGLGFADRAPLELEIRDLYVPLRARLKLPAGDAWERRTAAPPGRGSLAASRGSSRPRR